MDLYLPELKVKGRFCRGCIPHFANKKFVYTSEQKRQNSLSALEIGRTKGIKRPAQNKPVVVVNCIGFPMFFENIKSAAAHLKISHSNVSETCAKKRKTLETHGYKCFFKNDSEMFKYINKKYL